MGKRASGKRKQPGGKVVRASAGGKAPRRKASRGPGVRGGADRLLAPVPGADHQEVGGVKIDVVRTANGRIKRLIYPPGFRWSTHIKPVVGTEQCMHAHVGFLARGHVRGEYADGCVFEHVAPRAIVVEPGHDAWVVGKEAAVLIQFDAESDTTRRFGLPEAHRHS